ncbi:B3 domain-containing protein REM16-like isoform X2 [Ipomoea triloba]|uniref:B3 domain-containing protein REM16-like isoform X2 n=1 Tax=Ipomoea triloba TaxID=35885 RepID=UPI00125E4BF1|nr:B3 domain-containing protein REM16-like isoform X2 [Ipomoea triloba]
MGDDCRGCQKWEEHIYWSRFQAVQFFQILSGCYNEKLAVPQKFVNNLREKLAGCVSLKGPSGAIWNIGLTACGEKLYFQRGWKEFVEEHSLQENDVLIFKYNGGSQFDVLMFDQQSCCEKEASYFIRKCGHQELINGGKANGNPTPETNSESSVEVIRATKRKKPTKGGALAQTSVKQGTQAKRGARKGSMSKSSSASRFQLKSNRRPVTEEEKGNAIQMASAVASCYGFVAIMTPGNVYRGFFLTIPADWARKYLPTTEKNFDLTLRVKENAWTTRCYQKQGHAVVTGTAYRNFVLENNLEEFDVCVFRLASRSDDIVFDVSIFRVVEEVVPPSRVTQAVSSRCYKQRK